MTERLPSGLLLASNQPAIAALCAHYDIVYQAIHDAGGDIDWRFPTRQEDIEAHVHAGRLYYTAATTGGVAASACLDVSSSPTHSMVWYRQPATQEILRGPRILRGRPPDLYQH
jgi:hypothetical protein